MAEKVPGAVWKKLFSDEEKQEIHSALQRTWSSVGYDILDAVGGKSIPRSHVIEIVLDASYLEDYGSRRPETKELIKRFRTLDYKQQIKAARETFKFARYGM